MGKVKNYFLDDDMNPKDEPCIPDPPEPERITQEQAVQVAGWLGFKHDNAGFFQIPNLGGHTIPELIQYLYSPEGQEAVIDRLEKLYIRQEHWPASIGPDSIIYKLSSGSFDWLEYKRVHAQGRAPTRQHALLLAVLEMLRGGE